MCVSLETFGISSEKREVVGLFGSIQLQVARDRVLKRVVLVAYFG